MGNFVGCALLVVGLLVVAPATGSDGSTAHPAPTDSKEAVSGAVADGAAGDAPHTGSDPLPDADHPDLRRGSFGVFEEGERHTPFNTAKIGIIDGRLHVIAARWEGGIYDPGMDMRFDVAISDIAGVGIKGRQLQVDLGDRKLALHFSGSGIFYDRKAVKVYFDQLVAAGVPAFKPRRHIDHPPRVPIYIYM